MFQDVELSREVQQAFATYCSGGANSVDARPSGTLGGPEMVMQVLTTGYWPTTPSLEGLILPPELITLRHKFASYYMNKYQGRRLVPAPSLERCVVTARFPKGKKDLEVSLFQV